jgi:hypothetical protein
LDYKVILLSAACAANQARIHLANSRKKEPSHSVLKVRGYDSGDNADGAGDKHARTSSAMMETIVGLLTIVAIRDFHAIAPLTLFFSFKLAV